METDDFFLFAFQCSHLGLKFGDPYGELPDALFVFGVLNLALDVLDLAGIFLFFLLHLLLLLFETFPFFGFFAHLSTEFCLLLSSGFALDVVFVFDFYGVDEKRLDFANEFYEGGGDVAIAVLSDV